MLPAVLVVERDRLLRWALSEALSDARYEVTTVPSGQCAQDLPGDVGQHLALAIVDDDSWPWTAQARAAFGGRWPAVPVIVTTQSDDPAIERRARQHGAAAVLIKPYDLATVVSLTSLYCPDPCHTPPFSSSTMSS